MYSRPSQLFIIGIIRCDPLRSIQSKTCKSGARQTREHSEVCKTKLHEGGRGCVTMQYYARGGNHKQQRKMECLLMGEGWCAVGDRNIGHKSPPLSAAVSASAGPTPQAHAAASKWPPAPTPGYCYHAHPDLLVLGVAVSSGGEVLSR